MDTDPYKTIYLGNEAYTVSKFSDRNVRTIIQPVGSGGPVDPLDQFGSIGWKASLVTGVLGQSAVIPLPDGPIQHDEIVEATKKWEAYFND